MRPRNTCPSCNEKPVAVAYHRNGRTYYRAKCTNCLKNNVPFLKRKIPKWVRSGYKKKPVCEKCSFQAKVAEQLVVVHTDGNINNTDWFNLKTICLNCLAEVQKNKSRWTQEIL